MNIVKNLRTADDALPDEIVEDRSRYQVEWTMQGPRGNTSYKGESIGPPRLYPLRSVMVVAGVKEFSVVDPNGNIKWEASLSYPLSLEARYSDNVWDAGYYARSSSENFDSIEQARSRFPFVEHDGVLYSFDEGVIAARSLATGEVKWRVTSVNTRKILFALE